MPIDQSTNLLLNLGTLALLVVAVFGAGVTWGITSSRLTRVEKDINALWSRQRGE